MYGDWILDFKYHYVQHSYGSGNENIFANVYNKHKTYITENPVVTWFNNHRVSKS